MNFETKLPRHNLEHHSLYIFEKYISVLFHLLFYSAYFCRSRTAKKSELKKILKPDGSFFFPKYTAREALSCAATASFGNSCICMTKATIGRWKGRERAVGESAGLRKVGRPSRCQAAGRATGPLVSSLADGSVGRSVCRWDCRSD